MMMDIAITRSSHELNCNHLLTDYYKMLFLIINFLDFIRNDGWSLYRGRVGEGGTKLAGNKGNGWLDFMDGLAGVFTLMKWRATLLDGR